MVKWRGYLKGNEQDIQLMSEHFDDEIEIVEEDDSYYMRSDALDGCQTADEFRENIKKELDTLNGLANILFGYKNAYSSIELAHVKKIEQNSSEASVTTTVDMVIRDELKLRERLKVQKLDEGGEVIEETQTGGGIQELAELSGQENEIRELASYFVKEDSWHNLNNIIEFIQDNMDKTENNIVEMGWADSTELELFGRTANSREALGSDARHGDERTPKPENPMEKDKAVELTYRVANKWLRFKMQNQ